jgi:hypothetical protein
LHQWGFSTSNIAIRPMDEHHIVYEVKNITWVGQPIEALINSESEKFIQVKLSGGKILRHLDAESLTKHLKKLSEQNTADSVKNNAPLHATKIVPQTTPEVLLIKKIIEQNMSAPDLNITRKNIIALDQNYENFLIKEVTYGRYFRVSFNYQKSTGNITDVVIEAGSITSDFAGPYQKPDFIKLLESETDAILKR